jgi:glycosyltransferase involved in cell wall biosynthesis
VDNVGDWLSSFDVFMFPSLDEALGSTLLDAMQVGLPIVASKVGGIPDVVEDGVNGRLVEPEDAEALYAAIDGLLADDEALAAIRARNIEKSRSFSATRMAEAYETLYREIAPSM